MNLFIDSKEEAKIKKSVGTILCLPSYTAKTNLSSLATLKTKYREKLRKELEIMKKEFYYNSGNNYNTLYRIKINSKGKVTNVKILSGSGNTNYDNKVRDLLRNKKFKWRPAYDKKDRKTRSDLYFQIIY